MNIERLRSIISYSNENGADIYSYVRKFCSIINMEYESDMLNILQIVRTSFRKKGFLVLEMPIKDEEIGALCYRGDGLGYVVINSSLPRVNANFAIAHEIYHVFFQENGFVSKVEFVNDHYYEHDDEYAANLFAGILLMPEIGFRRMFNKFKEESDGDVLDTIIRLMSYYQVPYMSVLIRCLELEMFNRVDIPQELFCVDRNIIISKFEELWLDDSILYPSNRDDYQHLEIFVEKKGQELIKEEYINKRTLEMVLNNMQELYRKITGV